MSKRVDFAKKRKTQGRSFSSAVSELAALMQPLARGVDLQERLKESAAQHSENQRLLAERLQDPVVPLFIDNGAGPDRIGSCVLVRHGSDFFAFTAAHVVRDVGSALLLAPSEAKGGKLLPLPPCTAHLNSSGRDNDLDVGVMVLPSGRLGPFAQHTFLAGTDIDEDDLADNQASASFYFVLGYSASRTQVNVSRAERQIHQQSFHCATSPVSAAEYEQEGLSPAEHILLDFDHEEIVVEGKRIHPPKLQGVSGGGIFLISRETSRGPLIAIATQNRRRSRLIVGTRIRHFLRIIRELKAASQQ